MSSFTELCFNFPDLPVQGIAERKGSGKLSLSKGGASGTRVWVCPWEMHPLVMDRLLGQVSPSASAIVPSAVRPAVFSPAYPWLYCQDVSMEGEDPWGVDRYGQIAYRRAILTCKYAPLEMGNSIHIHSQMLTLPGSQFIFTGPFPAARLGDKQTFAAEIKGAVIGGTFELGIYLPGVIVNKEKVLEAQRLRRLALLAQQNFEMGTGTLDQVNAAKARAREADDLAVVAPRYTARLPFNATPAQITKALRATLGLRPGQDPYRVHTIGPGGGTGVGGPWIIEINGDLGYEMAARPHFENLFPDAIYARDIDADERLDPNRTDDVPILQEVRGENTSWFCFEFAGNPGGAQGGRFTLKATYNIIAQNKTTATYQKSQTIHTTGLNSTILRSNLEPCVKGFVKRRTKDEQGGPTQGQDKDVSIWVSSPFVDGIAHNVDNTYLSMAQIHRKPVRFYVAFFNTTSKVAALDLCDVVGFNTATSTVKITKLNPWITDRLDQNVGKRVPQGEITVQKHQVLHYDLIYFLNTVGTVNMFSFMGFPPWTLLLTGVDAKQTRLSNGTPCWDLTFKFSYNPYTHQALFRPGTMRWEFVRGIIQLKVPSNIYLPVEGFDPISGRAKVQKKAARRATYTPPRRIGFFNGDFEGAPNPQVPDASIPPRDPTFVGAGEIADGPDSDATWLEEAASRVLKDDESGILHDLQETINNPNLTPEQIANLRVQLTQAISDNLVGSGPANDDQAAMASGRELDIADGIAAGAPWSSAANDGINTEDDSGGGPYGYAGIVAAAQAAHERGMALTEEQREILGMPTQALVGGAADPGAAAVADLENRVGLGVPEIPLPPRRAAPANNRTAINLGGSTAPASIRVFDLGYIYPICDFTPIAWMV